MPRRSHDFMNSSGRSLKKLTRSRPYNPAFVHPEDLAALGIASGESVEIRSAHDAIRAVVQADATLRRGVVAMTHAFGGQPDEDHRHREIGSNTGRLIAVDLDYDPVCGDPENGRTADLDHAGARVTSVSEIRVLRSFYSRASPDGMDRVRGR